MLVIVARHRATDYGSLAKEFEGIPECRVILDRRLGERRTGRLQDPEGLAVVFVC